jgi:hypothetical protein
LNAATLSARTAALAGSKNRLTARVLEDMNQVWTELVSEGTAALDAALSLACEVLRTGIARQ